MSQQRSEITVTEGINNLLITDSARPGQAWRITNHKLLATYSSDRDFVVIELLEGFTRVAEITIEVDPRQDRIAVGFCEDRDIGSYINLALHAASATAVPMVVETPTTVFYALYNRADDTILGELPPPPLDANFSKVFTALLRDVETPLKAWSANAGADAKGYGTPGVIFRQSKGGGKKDKCDEGSFGSNLKGVGGALGMLVGALVFLNGGVEQGKDVVKEGKDLVDEANKDIEADKKKCKDKEKKKKSE